MATGTPIGLQEPPSLTTTERNALTSPQNGWCIYNTTLQSYEIYMASGITGAAWYTVNQGAGVIDSYTTINTPALTDVGKIVILPKAGYTMGFAILTGPNTPGSAAGKSGVGVMLTPRGGVQGYYASLDISASYPCVFSQANSATVASSNSFDTGWKFFLKSAKIDSGGGTVTFIFRNGAVTPASLNVKIELFVW